MTKSELLFLEKVFGKEISGSMLQSKSKIAKKLENEGYIQKIQKTFSDRMGSVMCEGYILTLKGNITYCTSYLCDYEEQEK